MGAKKLTMTIMLVLFLTGILPVVFAQEVATPTLVRPRIKTIGFLGKGIAVSPSDPMESHRYLF